MRPARARAVPRARRVGRGLAWGGAVAFDSEGWYVPGDIARLRSLGTDFKKLAENGVEIFFTQVFRDGFFHADMHPGNIFIDEHGDLKAALLAKRPGERVTLEVPA